MFVFAFRALSGLFGVLVQQGHGEIVMNFLCTLNRNQKQL